MAPAATASLIEAVNIVRTLVNLVALKRARVYHVLAVSCSSPNSTAETRLLTRAESLPDFFLPNLVFLGQKRPTLRPVNSAIKYVKDRCEQMLADICLNKQMSASCQPPHSQTVLRVAKTHISLLISSAAERGE